MAITGTVSLVTAGNLAAVASNWQAVQAELIADYGSVCDLSLAGVTTYFNDPLVTMVKYIDSTNAFRGAAMFFRPHSDLQVLLVGTDKTLAVADRKAVAMAMFKGAAQRLINLGLANTRMFGSLKSGGNLDILLSGFPQLTRTIPSPGLVTYAATATVVAQIF